MRWCTRQFTGTNEATWNVTLTLTLTYRGNKPILSDYLFDVACKSFVQILHIFLFPFSWRFDSRDTGTCDKGVGTCRRCGQWTAIVNRPFNRSTKRRRRSWRWCSVDDQVSRCHQRLVDRCLGLVRGTRLVRCCTYCSRRTLGCSFTCYTYLGHGAVCCWCERLLMKTGYKQGRKTQ